MSPTAPLSKRGFANLQRDLMIEMSNKVGDNSYDAETNPRGIIDIGSATNTLMLDYIDDFSKKMPAMKTKDVIPYGSVAGSEPLLNSLASYMNTYFQPQSPIKTHNLLATNGVTSLLDLLTFNLCNPNEAILCATPLYGMFIYDACSRNDIQFLTVSTGGLDLDSVFLDGHVMLSRYEEILMKQRQNGIVVKAILIANPHNPTGRAYSRAALRGIMNLCAKWKIHLISDEIYGMSVFTNGESEGGRLPGFTSTLSVESELCEEALHVLYGVSKDFGAGGSRLGFLCTRNPALRAVVRRLCMFTWITASSDLLFSNLLADTEFLTRFQSTSRERLHQAYKFSSLFFRNNDIRFEASNSALVIWLSLRPWLPYFSADAIEGNKSVLMYGEQAQEIRLAEYLLEKGVYVELGAAFYAPVPGWFRHCYATEHELVKLGLQRLVAALEDLESNLDDENSDVEKQKKSVERKSKQQSKRKLRRLLGSILCARD